MGLWGYSGFGETGPQVTPDAPNGFVFNLRYPGQYFDSESGLFYNWHRSYDPRTGRYTQPDPIGLTGGWNRFVYAENDPFMYYDPEGLWVWGDPIDPDIAHAATGFGDGVFNAVTLGIGDLNKLRSISGIEGGIDTSCTTYQASKVGGRIVGAVALSGAIADKSFSPRGWTNSNRYLRIGWGRHNGYKVFRISGNWIKTQSKHIDLFRGGKL